MLNHVEPFWVIFRYLLALFLDLGISVLLSFGLVGFYFGLEHFSVVEFWSCHSLFGLGHFSVVEFWSIQVVFQKHIVNTKQSAIFGLRC